MSQTSWKKLGGLQAGLAGWAVVLGRARGSCGRGKPGILRGVRASVVWAAAMGGASGSLGGADV